MNVSVPFVDDRATAVRPGWDQLPEPVRALLINRLGQVESVAVAGSGLTPSFAATLTTADGVFFVKAADTATEFGRANQREAAVPTALPPVFRCPYYCGLTRPPAGRSYAWRLYPTIRGPCRTCAVLSVQATTAQALAVPSAELRQAVNERSFAQHCHAYLDTWRNVADQTMPLPRRGSGLGAGAPRRARPA